ncbi:MAG: hypothetical protein CML06_06210 [Pseudomonadales bacterium]|nr:hypothetical protein [Pseudomonadales bacterium]
MKPLHSIVAALLLGAGTLAQAGIIDYDFTTCGASGATGGTQAMCDATYSGTSLEGMVTVNQGIQSWTVPTTGRYSITAVGAQGFSGQAGYDGGLGALVFGTFDFSAGTMLQLLVGQQGVGTKGTEGGGGGGSFVVNSVNSPLLVAGGGGGTRTSVSQNGNDASATRYGTSASGSSPVGGGVEKTTDLGLGGDVSSSSWGSGGAGFYGDGADDDPSDQGGTAWLNGMLGGTGTCGAAEGGFGGGGAGGCYGGGGGGGYSGGDGGRVAGGGGSFFSGMDAYALAGLGTGDGSILIELVEDYSGPVAVSEPATLLLLGLGLAGLGWQRRKGRG